MATLKYSFEVGKRYSLRIRKPWENHDKLVVGEFTSTDGAGYHRFHDCRIVDVIYVHMVADWHIQQVVLQSGVQNESESTNEAE